MLALQCSLNKSDITGGDTDGHGPMYNDRVGIVRSKVLNSEPNIRPSLTRGRETVE